MTWLIEYFDASPTTTLNSNYKALISLAGAPSRGQNYYRMQVRSIKTGETKYCTRFALPPMSLFIKSPAWTRLLISYTRHLRLGICSSICPCRTETRCSSTSRCPVGSHCCCSRMLFRRAWHPRPAARSREPVDSKASSKNKMKNKLLKQLTPKKWPRTLAEFDIEMCNCARASTTDEIRFGRHLELKYYREY